MAILQCGGCKRYISLDGKAGPYAVADLDPEMWSSAHRRCVVCSTVFCDRCVPDAQRSCQECGARFDGRSAGSTAVLAWIFAWSCCWLAGLWALLVQTPGMAVPLLQVLQWVVGFVAGWKAGALQGRGAVGQMTLGFGLMVPLLNLVLLAGMGFDALRRRSTAAAAYGTAGQTVKWNELPAGVRFPLLKPSVSAVYALQSWLMARGERSTASSPPEVEALVRSYCTYDFGRERDYNARSVLVPLGAARELAASLADRFGATILIFAGTSRWLGDEEHSGQQELVIAMGTSKLDALRVARTNAVNFGMNTDQLIDRLQRYDQQHGIHIHEASSDTVGFALNKAPADPKALAADLVQFCPDLLDAGGVDELAIAVRDAPGNILLWWD